MTVTGSTEQTDMDRTQSMDKDRNSSRHFLYFGLLLAVQLLIFYQSYWSMVEVWWRSETFAHGFLIAPISLYLIWGKRDKIKQLQPACDPLALIFLGGLGFAWLLARLVDVQVVEQLAVVLMIPVLVWLVLGLKMVFLLLFPLMYLLFGVPIGEFLIYPMMGFTADFTVNAIKLTGIPVFREGMFFTIPSGNWSIVEGCSGVRYIIASLTLGTLYAYITYASYWRRTAFILLSILFPIIANGLRAYMIVMIGHLSSMKLATGVDHLIYGWVWFGLVMFFMFWLGSFWRDDRDEDQEPEPEQQEKTREGRGSFTKLYLLVAVVILGVWPLWAYSISQSDQAPFQLKAPELSVDWRNSPALFTEWEPRYIEPSQVVHQSYLSKNERVGLYLAYYGKQKQGAELINSQNVMVVQKHPVWRQPSQIRKQVNVGVEQLSLWETKIDSTQQKLLVWHWNSIDGQAVTSSYYAKLLEVWMILQGKGRAGTAIVAYVEYTDNIEIARSSLKQFVSTLLPEMTAK